jgi:hypothetical protein
MKKMVSCLVVLVAVLAFTAEVMATEPSGPAMDAVKKTGQYTKDVVVGTVKTVGEAAKGTVDTAVSPIKATDRALKGEGDVQEIVTDPINQGGETVHDTIVSTGETVQGKK